MSAEYGLLIDYEYCTGCKSCEVTCKESHNIPVGKWGIRVFEDGPWALEEGGDIYNYNFYPCPTDLCDLCEERVGRGKEPLCVHHCLANVMTYGKVEDLAKKLGEKTKQVLWVPQYKPFEAKGEFKPSGRVIHEFKKISIEENTSVTNATQRRSDEQGVEAAKKW